MLPESIIPNERTNPNLLKRTFERLKQIFKKNMTTEIPNPHNEELEQIPQKSGYAELINNLRNNPDASFSEGAVNELTMLYGHLRNFVINEIPELEVDGKIKILKSLYDGNLDTIGIIAFNLVNSRLGRYEILKSDLLSNDPKTKQAIRANQLKNHMEILVFQKEGRRINLLPIALQDKGDSLLQRQQILTDNRTAEIAGVPIRVRAGLADVSLDPDGSPK